MIDDDDDDDDDDNDEKYYNCGVGGDSDGNYYN